MRICMISPTFLPTIGGSQVAIDNIGRRLAERGIDMTLVTLDGRSRSVSIEEGSSGFRIVRVPRIRPNFMSYPFDQVNVGRIVTSLCDRGRKLGLIHLFHVIPLGPAALLTRKSLKLPIITSVMGWDTYDPIVPAYAVLAPVARTIMNHSEVVTAPSRNAASWAMRQGCRHIPTIVPHGVDTDFFNPARFSKELREEISPAGETVFVAVQRLHRRKRLDILIKAFAGLIRTRDDAKLVIIGGGDESASLQQLSSRLSVESSITFAGRIDRQMLAAYLATSDVFVMNSTYEAFGIAVAEAMASGLPAIASKVGSLPELVYNGQNGFLVPALDVRAMTDAMEEIMKDRPRRQSMGRLSRETAVSKYDWNVVIGMYVEVYRRCIGDSLG